MTGGVFTVDLRCDCPPGEALRRVLDLRAHTRLIPLTTVTPAVAANQLQPGFRFVARTGVGPLAFDDVMVVEEIDAASARIAKQGRIIQGSIALGVTAEPGGSAVRWQQQVRLPWLPSFLQPAAACLLRFGYRRVLKRLLEG